MISIREKDCSQGVQEYLKQSDNKSKYIRDAIEEKFERENSPGVLKQFNKNHTGDYESINTENLSYLKEIISEVKESGNFQNDLIDAFNHLNAKLDILLNNNSNVNNEVSNSGDMELMLKKMETRIIQTINNDTSSLEKTIKSTLDSNNVIKRVDEEKQVEETQVELNPFEEQTKSSIGNFSFSKKK